MELKNRKIVLLSSSLAGGGAEGVCVNIANNLASLGWNVDLLVLTLKDEAYLNRLSKKVNLVDLNSSKARFSIIPLLKYIYKNKPKLILVFNYELSVMLVILRYLLRFRVKIISRNSSTLSIVIKEFQTKSIWAKYFIGPSIKYLYQKIDHVINQCNGMRDDLIEVHPNLYEKSSVIYNPISSHIINYVKKNNLSSIKRENYFLCVGRLEEVKAFHYAIESFAKIAYKFPNLRLKIVGQGSLENELRLKAKALSVLDRVDFEGFKKNIIPYYLHARATILTSIYEGYPNSLIESIALGTPVVSFDCKSGPNEIIKNNINGYLARYQDAKDLKNKMIKILNTRFKRKEIISTLSNNQSKYVYNLYENIINQFNEFSLPLANQKKSLISKKILHIITGLGDGGAENTLFKVCKYDTENKHIVISLTNLGKYEFLLKNIGIKVYNLDLKFYSILKFLFLIKLIRYIKPDIIQTWLIMADLIGGIAGRIAGIKNIIWNIHFTNLKLDSTKLRNLLIIRVLAKLSYLIPKKTVVVSKSGIKNCKNLGYSNKKLIFIPNGYELNIFKYSKHQEKNFKKKFKIKKNIPIIGNVSRYDPIKDHNTLLEALSLILLRKKNFFCFLVGSGLSIKNENLRSQIIKLGLENNVKLLGTKKNITEIMNGLDVHILTSKSEAFPNVVVEAMACRTPCIVTNVGDCSSIIGKTGWLVPPQNPARLAKKIESVFNQIGSKDWNKRRNESRLRIKENFDISRMIKSLNYLWIKVLKTKN